jgi:hypothetical protein
MTRYLVTWKAVNSRVSDNRETRIKTQMAHTQLVQESLKSGALKEWGTEPDGQRGYAIFEGSEADMALLAAVFVPYYEFQVVPIMTADQWMGALKTAA